MLKRLSRCIPDLTIVAQVHRKTLTPLRYEDEDFAPVNKI
jgi:hypothetical protein